MSALANNPQISAPHTLEMHFLLAEKSSLGIYHVFPDSRHKLYDNAMGFPIDQDPPALQTGMEEQRGPWGRFL